jgi:hypothetical protein
MSRRLLCVALATCSMCAVGCSARADEKSKNLNVVCLGRCSAGFPAGKGAMSGRMMREIARQSFLVAARDQLGLRTRDVSLGDEMPSGGDNAPFDLAMVPADRTFLDVRRGFVSPSKTLLSEPIHATETPPENLSKSKFGMPLDYRAWLAEMEQLSRGGFSDAIVQAGFSGTPNPVKDSAEVPRAIETL